MKTFKTEKRIHMGLTTRHFDESLAFYRTLFAAEPVKLKPSAYHRVVDYYRARGKPPPPPEAEGDAEEEGNRSAEVAGWLRPFVDSLGPEDREILVAIEFEGRTQKEAAAALGLSLAAAKSRHRRAKQRLQAALRACCEFHLDRRRNITDIRAKGESCACGDKPS